MKRLILSILAAIGLGFGAAAGEFIEIDVHAGAGQASVLQNYESRVKGISNFMMSPGMRYLGGVNIIFSVNPEWAVATGVDYDWSSSGYAMSLIDADRRVSSLYMRNSYSDLNVPIYVSWRSYLGMQVRFNVDFGWYFAFGLGGKMKASGYVPAVSADGTPIYTSISHRNDYFYPKNALINGVRSFDHGLRLGVGFTFYDHYSINSIFQLGARDLALNSGVMNIDYHNVSLAFALGYIF